MEQRTELFKRYVGADMLLFFDASQPELLLLSFISPMVLCAHPCELLWSLMRLYFLHREQRWGLNTYLYAPKDDSKHRMYWRDLYTAEEAGESQQSPNT